MSAESSATSHRPAFVLGISADYHDAAAALIHDGVVVAAVQEERFSRRKHDPDLPVRSIEWCLESAGVGPSELGAIAYHGKPLTTYERILRSQARRGPGGFLPLVSAVRSWTGRKLWIGYRIDKTLRQLGYATPAMSFVPHHLAHAASAFYPSPFEHAAVVTVDGVGEWATASIAHGRSGDLAGLLEVRYPHSLGLLYSALTAFCGFEVNDGESKLMGLAPYGTPRFASVIRDELVELLGDGSFRLNMKWFDFEAGRSMANPGLATLFDGPAREAGSALTQRDADVASSIQAVLDEAVLGIARRAHLLTGEQALCLAGGVALNCVSNGRLLDHGPFDRVWVQPAAGDAGGALGAALWHHHVVANRTRVAPLGRDAMRGSMLGPSFGDSEIAEWLTEAEVAHDVIADLSDRCERAAADLAGGQVVGWFQGAAEFGPRALGSRSILADPRRSAAVAHINERVKGREGFRPLAPAVLSDRVGELFRRNEGSPFMLMTDHVTAAEPLVDINLDAGRPPSDLLARVESPLPGATHVDGSARLQAVDRDRFPLFWQLIAAFEQLTGCPAVINTSFNVAGEPIVNTPAEALDCAARAGLDSLWLGASRIGAPELRRLAPSATS